MSDSKNDKAQRRTDWAEDRTLMASERSFVSWIGTGLGCVGVAIGLQAVFGEFVMTWLPKSVATLFLLSALVLTWSAYTRACNARTKLQENDAEPADTKTYTLVASLTSAAIVLTGVVLWLI